MANGHLTTPTNEAPSTRLSRRLVELTGHVRRAFAGGWRVWTVIATLVTAACLASIAVWDNTAAVDQPRVPFWVLLAAFALVEAFPIHVQFRSEASSFSLFEVPLIIGVLLSDATALIPAVAIGSTVVLLTVRRQPFPKLVFNGANQVLQATVTVMLFHALSGSADPFTPRGSAVMLCAAAAASAQGVAAIGAVIVASEGRVQKAKLLNTFLFGVIVAIANVSLALIATLMLTSEPWAIGLLAVPLAVVYGSYRAFVSERAQRERFEFLYSSAKSIQSLDPELGIPSFLAEVSQMFRAARVDLILLPPSDSDELPVHYTGSADGEVTSSPTPVLDEATSAVLTCVEEPVLVTRSTGGPVGEFIRRADLDHAMVAVLRGESREFGILVAADPVGVTGGFADEHVRLYETLCNHAATALANERLEQALTKLRALERELSHQATHDGLTGLPNRTLLRRELDRLLDSSERLELLFIDLDDFKLVNDTLGHACGDDLLVEVAARINSCLRTGDLAARLGGDEFAVIVTGFGDTTRLAERIIEQVQQPLVLDGEPIDIGCSVGIATARETTNASELLRRADTAMYAAKGAGKGRVARFSETANLARPVAT